jgi:uncharacterized protein YbaR (Trm112 family)
MKQEVVASRECPVCREALLVVHEADENSDERTVAYNKNDRKRHVCFDLPSDANLLVMGDPDE